MPSKQNYYQILNLSPDTATEADIKANFRKLAFKWHPDRNGGSEESREKMQEILEAYRTLIDPSTKAQYDLTHANDITVDNNTGFAGIRVGGEYKNILEEYDGEDISLGIHLTLKQVLRGKRGYKVEVAQERDCPKCGGYGSLKKNLGVSTCRICSGNGKVAKQLSTGAIVQEDCKVCGGKGVVVKDPCPVCGSKGRVIVRNEVLVDIPAGINNGSILRVDGCGSGLHLNGKLGDLYITVFTEKDPVYHRQGQNLFMKLKVPPEIIMLGGEVDVPLPLGGTQKAIIPPCSKNNFSFVIQGHGVPSVNNINKRGSLVVALEAEFPSNLNDKEREALNAYAQQRKATSSSDQERSKQGEETDSI